jgi:hypothetical protein
MAEEEETTKILREKAPFRLEMTILEMIIINNNKIIGNQDIIREISTKGDLGEVFKIIIGNIDSLILKLILVIII